MSKQINPQIVRRLRKISEVLSAAVFLTGMAALLGWSFDIIFLKRIISSFPIIAPNTALAFLLLGIILFSSLRCEACERGYCSLTSGLLSSLIVAVGFLTLLEYLFGLNFGIDRLLFAGAQGSVAIRMSPQSAFNFLMVGVAFLFIFWQKGEKIKIGQVIILIAGAVSLLSLFGFIYNISSFYTIAPYKGMAAHTAIAFVMIFLAALFMRSEFGFMRIFVIRGLSGIAARRLIITLFIVIIAEVFVTVGQRIGLFDYSIEIFLHLLVIVGAFIYLIFFAFRSLDELGKMETSLVKTRELDQAKTEFVGLASHQLRTPLTAVSWYTEMLLGEDAGTINQKQKAYLKEIYSGNKRMIDLVDDLLNTSRIDMGTLKIKPKLVSLVEVMERTLKEFLPETGQKKIAVEKKFSRNLPRLLLDPELVGVVFQNIISNAVKYTSSGGKISVEIRRQNSHLLVKVADNGWGIPAAQQKKIFTKLFRADNVRQRDTEGTGLGLYIARAIVKKSRGTIRFESREGKGTTFYITFKA